MTVDAGIEAAAIGIIVVACQAVDRRVFAMIKVQR